MWTERPTRWPMTFGLTAGALLAVAWNNQMAEPQPKAPPAGKEVSVIVGDRGIPGVVVREVVHERILSADTVDGLKRQLRRSGFWTEHDYQQWSRTDGLLVVDWEPDPDSKCDERPVVRLELTTHLPRTANVPDPIARAFVPLREALERHEGEHARQWLHAAKGLSEELDDLDPNVCEGIRREVAHSVARWNEQVGDAGQALDADTADGLANGAFLNVPRELQFVHFEHALVAPIESGAIRWPTSGGIEPSGLDATDRTQWTECLQQAGVSDAIEPDALPLAVLSLSTRAGDREMGVFLDGTVTRRGRAWKAACVSDLLRAKSATYAR